VKLNLGRPMASASQASRSGAHMINEALTSWRGYSFYRFVFDVEVAIGEKVDDAADDMRWVRHRRVSTVDGNFRYAVDTGGTPHSSFLPTKN